MYRSATSLDPLLHRDDYTSTAAHDRDVKMLREGSWQLIASSCQLSKPGDYVATDRLGVALIVRNFDGKLSAVKNVCAHRHCRLVDDATGNSKELKCPYHGWRYGDDGLTRKLPGASNFPGFRRDQYRLSVFPVQQIGQLVFVHLDGVDSRTHQTPSEAHTPVDAGPISRFGASHGSPVIDSLDSWDTWQSDFANATDQANWRLILNEEYVYSCDWKVPIEGSLESYHLNEIHGDTLGEDPGESNTDHHFKESGTVFSTEFRESSLLANLEEWTIRRIRGSFHPTYRHVHVFPNVMASFTDSLSLVYQIFPDSPQSCRLRVFGFSPRSEEAGLFGNYLGWVLGHAAHRMAIKVLAEDAAIFPHVQQGMSETNNPRIFGRCEERLHAFHQHWHEAIENSCATG